MPSSSSTPGSVPEEPKFSPPGHAKRISAPTPKSLRSIRIVCVDDHALLIEGLKAQFAIDGSIHVIGQLPSAERLLEEVARTKPDLVLIDIEMPGPDAFETVDRLRHAHPEVRVVFLSAHIRDGYLSASRKCGASGYFAKGDELEDIVAGIKAAATGDPENFVVGPKVQLRCGQPNLTQSKARHVKGEVPGTPLDSLTARELEVLRLIGKGLSRVEIAAELCRSAKTIDGHQERMMKKLDISSRAELVRYAIREGLAEA